MMAAGLLLEGVQVVGHRWEQIGDEGFTSDQARIHLDRGAASDSISAILVAKFASAKRGIRVVSF